MSDAASNSTSTPPSFWDALHVLHTHKVKVNLCFFIVVTATVVCTVLLPKSYKSEAKIFVRLGRENVGLDPTATLGEARTINIMQTREQEMNSVAMIIRNRDLTEKVVETIGHERILEAEEPGGGSPSVVKASLVNVLGGWAGQLMPSSQLGPEDKAIRKCGRKLDVQAVPDTNLVMISYESHSPALSQQVVQNVIELYLDEHVRLHRTQGTHKFLAEQRDAMLNELERAEERLRYMRGETGLVAPAEQRLALVEKATKIETDYQHAQARATELEAEVQALRTEVESLPETVVLSSVEGASSFAADGMREQLYTLELREQKLLSEFTAEHVLVKQIRAQIEAAERILVDRGRQTETTRGRNNTYEETKLELLRKEPLLKAARAKIQALAGQVAEANQDLEQLNHNEIMIARLQREVEIAATNYRKYAADAEQARIDHSLETAKMSNISIAQPATLEAYPSSPNVKLNLLLGSIAAVFASSGLAFAAESRRRWKIAGRQQPSD